MGDMEDADSLIGHHPAQFIPHPEFQGRVQAGEGLIQQQKDRLCSQCPGNGYPLPQIQ